MRRQVLLAVCTLFGTTFLLLLIGSLVVSAQQSRRQIPKGQAAQNPTIFVGGDQLSPRALEQLEVEARRYTVQPMKFTDDGEVRPVDKDPTFLDISKRLQDLAPVPEDRLAYFAWLLDDTDPELPIEFVSWGCLLSDIEEVPGGWHVTLRVLARARARDKAQQDRFIAVAWRFLEEYYLTHDGALEYLRGYPHPTDGDKPYWFRTPL